MEWAIKAHDLTHDWFFKIIEGDLEKRFEKNDILFRKWFNK